MILEPNTDLAFFVLRLAVGLVFLAHGPAAVKHPHKLAQEIQSSPRMVAAVGAIEAVAAVLILLGIGTQLAALVLVFIMLGTIYVKTMKLNLSFTEKGGWELDFILLAAALAIVFAHPSSYSILP